MAQPKRKEKSGEPLELTAAPAFSGEQEARWEKPQGLTRKGWGVLALVLAFINLPLIHYFLLRGAPEANVSIPFADDFTDPATVAQHYFTTGGGLWRVVNGELLSPGTRNNPLWLKAKLPNNVRVSFDARSASQEGDIKVELFGNGIDHLSGYQMIYGGFGNTRAELIRSNGQGDTDEQPPTLAELESRERQDPGTFRKDTKFRVEAMGARAELGRTYHFVLERRGKKLRMTVDGQPLLELEDRFPFQGPGHDRLGLSSNEGDVYYGHLRVEPVDDGEFQGASPTPHAALPAAGPFEDHFTGTSLGPDWLATDPSVAHVENGAVTLRGGHNHPVWLRRPLPDAVAVDFDCWSDSQEGDLKIELFGDGSSFHTGELHAAYNATGYVFIMGGWNNTASVIARQAEHSEDRAIRQDVPVQPGRRYHWHITRQGGALHWQVDGKPFLDFQDNAPLSGPGHQFFAFSDWEAPVHFANLKIVPL
jgi:hypothetical protein